MKVNRKYKDRLFRIVFREKEDLLDLYNAVNGSAYDNPEELEIMTIEDVIYVHMKNDVAFLLSDLLNLWEHQSTFNPNMPARGLGYFAQLYQQYIEKYGVNLYSSKQKKLPFPQYIVFYNGEKDMPERMELRLSDAFFTKGGEKRHKQPAVEVIADMININVEKNAFLALLISGGLAGLAGGIEVAGSLGKVVVGASSGYGFNGIPVALIAHNNPILIIFSALLLAAMRTGSMLMQTSAGVSKNMVDMIQGLIIVFLCAEYVFRYYIKKGIKKKQGGEK